MTSHLTNLLKAHGFTLLEISLIEHSNIIGLATTCDLAESTCINRVIAYATLKRLTRKGYGISMQKNGTAYFLLDTVERILEKVEQRNKQLQDLRTCFI